MGIRKEWILSEQDIHRKKRKIEHNRRQGQTHEDVQGRRRRRRYFKKTKFDENLPIDQVHPLNIDDQLLMTVSNWSRIHQVQYAYTTQPIHSTLELIHIPAYLASIHLITFMKQIPKFDLLDTEDRVTLAKHNLLAVVFMHVVLLYGPIADTHHEINTEDPTFQGKDWIEILAEGFYHKLTNISTRLIKILQYDRVIVKIFLLLLFTKDFCGYDISHEPSLRNSLVVLNIQNRYLVTLYKYCLQHDGLTKAIILFTRALS
ncbi:unnamed protein product [Rotaria socialis]